MEPPTPANPVSESAAFSPDHTQAPGALLLKLDPKTIRPTQFRNRHERSLLLHDPHFIKLTKSLRAHGQETPIRVRSIKDAVPPFEFEIMSGHRRHAACLALDVATKGGYPILAILDTAHHESQGHETRDLVLKMYRENAEREDLSAYETGAMFKQWLDAGVFDTQEAISVATGQSKQNVGKYVALAVLPDFVLAAFRDPRVLSLRWSSELTGACQAQGAELIAVAHELAQRTPPPAPETVFAELTSATPKRTSRSASFSEVVKKDNQLLFELTSRDGRYSIRLGKPIDPSLRPQLQQDLKDWLHAWISKHLA